jgi:hypothetical protein
MAKRSGQGMPAAQPADAENAPAPAVTDPEVPAPEAPAAEPPPAAPAEPPAPSDVIVQESGEKLANETSNEPSLEHEARQDANASTIPGEGKTDELESELATGETPSDQHWTRSREWPLDVNGNRISRPEKEVDEHGNIIPNVVALKGVLYDGLFWATGDRFHMREEDLVEREARGEVEEI